MKPSGKRRGGKARRRFTAALIVLAVFPAASPALSAELSAAHVSAQASARQSALWAALQSGGHVLLLRHAATVPGIGDPPGFRVDDCNTQRNLSDAGRAQARAWGKAFTTRGIPVGGVFSSVWCRCVETARLAFGRADTWPALNSHFDSPQWGARQAEQTAGGILVRMQTRKNLVLVTHQVNITELTGIVPAMGEAVVMRHDGKAWQVVGRFTP